MSLNLRIRDIRQSRGLTIAQLAEKVGVSTPHMSEVERGKKNLNNHLMERISAALGVAPEDLIASPEKDVFGSLLSVVETLGEEDRARVEAFAAALARSQQG